MKIYKASLLEIEGKVDRIIITVEEFNPYLLCLKDQVDQNYMMIQNILILKLVTFFNSHTLLNFVIHRIHFPFKYF